VIPGRFNFACPEVGVDLEVRFLLFNIHPSPPVLCPIVKLLRIENTRMTASRRILLTRLGDRFMAIN
jgi:hypothetical protein